MHSHVRMGVHETQTCNVCTVFKHAQEEDETGPIVTQDSSKGDAGAHISVDTSGAAPGSAKPKGDALNRKFGGV